MRIMSAIHPTNYQKRVLAIIASAPNPKVAGEQCSGDANLIAARNMLMKLQVITFSAGSAALTDKGQQIAQEENIVDQSGQLTDAGKQLVSGNQQQGNQAQQPAQDPNAGDDPFAAPGDAGMGGDTGAPAPAGGGGGLVGENFVLLKELLGV